MNDFPTSQDKDDSGQDRAAVSNVRTWKQTKNSFSPRTQTAPNLRCLEAMAFWSRAYDLRGGVLQPWDGAVLFPGSAVDREAEKSRTARAIEAAITTERSRLARDLHDAVTQTLFAASLLAELLPELWETDVAQARKCTEDLRRLTCSAHAEMRTLLFELRPASLDQAKLRDLLKQLSEALMGRTQLPICLDVQGDYEIPCDVKVEMYRIVQESLNNVVKYAQATHADITLRLEADHVHLEVKDNGVGFDQSCVKPSSSGLRIMRERAEAIQAELQVCSQPGLGTTVVLDWKT